MNRLLAVLAVLAVCATPHAPCWPCSGQLWCMADVGPKPRSRGQGPEALGRDMKGIAIEMTDEHVSLTLGRNAKDKYSEELRVHVLFHMTNPGAEEAFETGFPVGPIMNMSAFSVKVDGAAVTTQQVDRKADASKKPGDRKSGWPGDDHDYWQVWEGRYKAKGVTAIEVAYILNISHHSDSRYAGYILHTGAPWKGPIGKATVSLKCADGLTLDNLRQVWPAGQAEFKGDHVDWIFENFEPTKDHDINILYDRKETWQEELADLRKSAPNAWSVRWSLANHLKTAASRRAEAGLTAAQADEHLDSCANLVSDLTEEDGKFVLPGIDPTGVQGIDGVIRYTMSDPRRRYYADIETYKPAMRMRTWSVFSTIFKDALATAPKAAGAKKSMTALRDFMKHFIAGDLYVDLRKMPRYGRPEGEGTLCPVGPLSKDEDEECRKLIQSAEEWLSRP